MKQLDIKKIYDSYDNLQEPEKQEEAYSTISTEAREIYVTNRSYMNVMARVWDECIHFYEGDQHLRYSESLNLYQPVPENKYNKFIPRPVTNYIFPTTNTMVSLLTKSRPEISVWRNSDKAEDINRAALADKLLDAKWEIDRESMNYATAAKIKLMLGTVYRKDYWDTTGVQTIKIPKPQVEGMPQEFDELPLGETAVNVLSPFEVIPDFHNAINCLDDGYYVMQAGLYDVNWIKNNYGKEGDGYTGKGLLITPDEDLNNVLYYFERLKGSSGHNGQIGERVDSKNSAVMFELYIRPDLNHKKGLMIVIANSKVLYIKECKYTLDNGKNWHPYSMDRYEQHPFRHHGLGMVEQIIPPQKRVNSIDALIILNRMTNAIPQWLMPLGCLVKDSYVSGAPGLIIDYNAGAGTPTRLPGSALDGSVYREREEAKATIHELAGDNEVLQGLRPAGVGTAAGLNLLLEQSQSKFTGTVLSQEKFIEESQTKKMNLMCKFYKEPRPELINRIKAYNKENTAVEIDDLFTGQMLGDNIDVRVEVGSTMPRSKVVEQQNLKDLAAQQVFGPLDPMSNPMGNKEFLKRFDIKGFPMPTAKDLDRAEWENDLLRQAKFDQVEVMPFDEPVIHWKVVIDAMKGKEFYQVNSPQVVEEFLKHALGHLILMMPEQVQMIGVNQGQYQQFMTAANQLQVIPQGQMPLPDEMRLQVVEETVSKLQGLAQKGLQMAGADPQTAMTATTAVPQGQPGGQMAAPTNQPGNGGSQNNSPGVA